MTQSVVEYALGYKFKDKNLLKRALTLASADGVNNNQRLEFFGDAILEFIVSEHIYDESKSEGNLTELRKSLVSDEALTPVSVKLGLDRQLIKSSGDNNNKKSVPSAYEAVLAAIYLDGGMDEARAFVTRTLDFTPRPVNKDPKTLLQELLQGIGEPKPVYKHEERGTPQNPRFLVRLDLHGKTFCGEAESITKAEKEAASKAYEYLTKTKGIL